MKRVGQLLFILVLCLCMISAVSAQEQAPDFESEAFDLENGEASSYAFEKSDDISLLGVAGEKPAEILSEASEDGLMKSMAVEDKSDEVPTFAIFGRDDRSIIRFSPTNLPYSAVARIETDQSYCSGFMIGPHYAVTTADCLYDKYGGWAKYVKVCPALAAGYSHAGCSTGTRMWIMDKNLSMDGNVGVVKVDSSLGTYSGWLGYWTIPDSKTYDYATVLGYASDESMRYMFYSNGYLSGTAYYGTLLQYKMDTTLGSCGGPVVINNEYVVGINAYYGSDYNYAVRLTNSVFNFLQPYWGK